MSKLEKIIEACDRIKGPFMVRDIIRMSNMEDNTQTSRNVSAELYRLASRGILVPLDKIKGRNVYQAPSDRTVAEAYASYPDARANPKERETKTVSRSYMLEHPMIPFPLGSVRMKAEEVRFFAAR